jgi:hypothetical protein
VAGEAAPDDQSAIPDASTPIANTAMHTIPTSQESDRSGQIPNQ